MLRSVQLEFCILICFTCFWGQIRGGLVFKNHARTLPARFD